MELINRSCLLDELESGVRHQASALAGSTGLTLKGVKAVIGEALSNA